MKIELNKRREIYFPLWTFITSIIIFIIIVAIIVAIICGGNWKCRQSALRCIRQTRERKLHPTQSALSTQSATPQMQSVPFLLSSPFPCSSLPLYARTQRKHVRHIMHAFYIIFDRPTRLESRSPLALRLDPLQIALPAPSAVPSASSSCSALIPINPGRADGRQA